jgi:hypothetical protein
MILLVHTGTGAARLRRLPDAFVLRGIERRDTQRLRQVARELRRITIQLIRRFSLRIVCEPVEKAVEGVCLVSSVVHSIFSPA